LNYSPTEETIAAFRERLSGYILRIRAGEFPERTGYGCTHCDYRMLCEGMEGDQT